MGIVSVAMAATARFDVVVVGASIAGCTAARLFALAGARVGLIERRPDPGAYKVVCTHQILSSAVPTIERLGLDPLLEARGRRARPCAVDPAVARAVEEVVTRRRSPLRMFDPSLNARVVRAGALASR